ncbi:MAG: PAS domain S-box protein [Alphaproteobacteria bacterium]|nr:PAS domain S-box protein [Alphaproteobacteria bacterium]
MPAHHYPFIDLAVHASVRDHFAKGDAVAVLSRDLGEVLWANGAAAQLFGFSNIYDALDEGLGGQTSTRRQIESAISGLGRTGRPQNFMMRAAGGFSRTMAPATLEEITLPDGAQALLLTSSHAGQLLAPGARARQIIAGFEGTGTHVAVLDKDSHVLAASSTFGEIGLASADIERMVADVADASDRLVKRMTDSPNGAMPTAIGRLADDPALHLLFAVEPAPADDAVTADDDDGDLVPDASGEDIQPVEATPVTEASSEAGEEDEAAAPAETEAPTAAEETSDTAEEVAAESAPETEAGTTGEPEVAPEPPRRTFFDTRRIRDELNRRLAKAQQESELPQAFEEARGLEVPPVLPAMTEDAADNAAETGEPDAAASDEGDRAELSQADATQEAISGEEAASVDEVVDQPAAGADGAEQQEFVADHGEMAAGDHETAAQEHAEDTAAGETDEPVLPSAGDEDRTEEAQDENQPEEVAAEASGFRFDPAAKAARFVWKINRDGEFSEVSPEFAAAVGPHSADIIGRRFPDLARVFNLDPDHVITDLLNRRDTWSGKTVLWPIQGTDLVTPVDLAALPTYTRDRHFDGFRGFGIVRIGEARRDPEALGLALVPGRVSPAVEAMREDYPEDAPAGLIDHDMSTIDDDADLEMRNLERDIEDLSRMDGVHDEATEEERQAEETNGDATGETGDVETGDEDSDIDETDPFRGERPAIRLVETPMRRDSDKIISLEAHRPRTARESLSPGEQAAFREIGARLSETTAPSADASADTAETKTESTAPSQPEPPQPFGKRQEPPRGDDGTPDEAEQPESPAELSEADALTPEETTVAGDAGHDEAAADAETAPETDAPSPAEPAEAREPAPLPSAFALPARQVMPAGMDAGIIDAIPAALLVHSGDELIHGNAEFFELTGYDSLADLADRGGLDHLLERPGEDEASGDGGLFVRRGDGGRREVTARLRSVNWGDGQALLLALSPREAATPVAEPELLGLQGDASEEPEPAREESHLATALAIEAQELRSILETATDGVVILNNDGTIRSMNGSACALFNYDEAETRDQPFAMLFAHESQRAVMDYVAGLAEHGVSSVLNDGREVIGREASGGFLPLFMTIGRLSGSNGYCAVLRDITNWKRTEEELRNAKRAAETANSHKSDFLARVSHEIRTPLNAIIGFSEMMVEERFGPIGSPRYLEYAHDIGNSGKHVLDIVNDLLDISKIEAGQVSMEFVSVSLNDHLAESVSLLQPMANSQRVIIRTSLSASVPEVVADQRSIKQIALNLLSNAIRYTPSGGQIVVSTSYEPSGNVVIRIRDTGIGMNRKELEQAMKPFGQVGPGPRQRGDGTGLGLPLTKAMVEANRAQFDIVSAPGEGTLVSISFPPQRVLAD